MHPINDYLVLQPFRGCLWLPPLPFLLYRRSLHLHTRSSAVMYRLSALLFVALALFSSQLALAAPCNCKHKGSHGSESSPPPSTSTPSYVTPTPVVNTDLPTTTVTSSTYNPNASGVPGSDQTTTPSPSPTLTPQPSSSTSSTPTSTPTGGVSADDISSYLSAHNTVRAQHGANPLTWSDDLSNTAQGWANNCIFEHSNGTLGAFGGKCLPSEMIP